MTGSNGFASVRRLEICLSKPFRSMSLSEHYRISGVVGQTSGRVAVLPLAVLRTPDSSGGRPTYSLPPRTDTTGPLETIARTERGNHRRGERFVERRVLLWINQRFASVLMLVLITAGYAAERRHGT
jgi:hypothetical protein